MLLCLFLAFIKIAFVNSTLVYALVKQNNKQLQIMTHRQAPIL